MRFQDLFQVQKASGEPVMIGDLSITPQSQALIVRLPKGAFVWNRPTAILVKRGTQVKQIPIVDFTRSLQMGLLGFGVVITIISLVKFARRKEQVL